MDDVAVVVLPGKGFAKLLERPLCGGMLGDVEMEDPPRAELHHDKDPKEVEPGRDDGEEVGGSREARGCAGRSTSVGHRSGCGRIGASGPCTS
jgi:hypothetical protein